MSKQMVKMTEPHTTKCIKYLITSNLSWPEHINNITMPIPQKLSYIYKKNLNQGINLLNQFVA